jgi:hypothetical protein
MKNKKKTIYFGLVLVVAGLMCLQAGAISTTFTTVQKNRSAKPTLLGDVLISSDNPNGDDLTPRIARNSEATLAVTYEKSLDIFSKRAPVLYSEDRGESWTLAYDIDSAELFDLSGILYNPDLIYNSNNDLFFWAAVDPLAEMYNNMMAFIPGDIGAGGDASLYAISGTGSTNYLESCAGCTNNFFISLTTEDGYGYESLFGLGYFTYPDFEHPPVMGGFYYDGNSVFPSAPASHCEVEVGNRIVCVFETGDQINVKSNTADETLMVNGEQQNGMDKYADIEQWPGENIATGSDPDVACSGNNVYVVYSAGGNVVLKYSSCSAGYEPEFNWQTTTIDMGAVPAVFAVGNKIVVGYAKNNNLYLATSADGGATFTISDQVNDVAGSVSTDPGSIDLTDLAVVWVDTRGASKDIYCEPLPAAIIEIGAITGGFGVSAVVMNTGTLDAESIPVTLTIDASLMLVGGEASETFNIPQDDDVTISSGFILGIGAATITVSAGNVIKTATGTVLGPFVIGL